MFTKIYKNLVKNFEESLTQIMVFSIPKCIITLISQYSVALQDQFGPNSSSNN